MSKFYFCGTDIYDCLPVSHKNKNEASRKVYVKPEYIPNISNLEFTHFYSVYQKQDSRTRYSWFVNGLGLPETQVFASALCITTVAACKNSIVGLSEDGNLYKISLEADDNRELLSLKTSSVITDEETSKVPFKRIVANENNIYGLQSTSEGSQIFKVESRLENIGSFPGTYIEEISVGYGHFVALSDTGAVWNWGNAGRSEVATSSEINVMKICEKPKRVDFFDDLPCIVVKIVCGGWHTLALTSDGDIYSWGWNESGQLGHSSSVTCKSDPYPVDLGSAQDPVTHIAAGSRHSVALLKSGKTYSWGRNEEGQCGSEIKESTGTPTEIAKAWSGTASNLKCAKWATFIYSDD